MMFRCPRRLRLNADLELTLFEVDAVYFILLMGCK